MTHYIAINGPPQSGRTTVAKLFQQRLRNSVTAGLNDPLKHLFCTALNMQWEKLRGDNPRDMLNGRTTTDAIRQLRYHLRGLYGPDVLARWLQFRVLGMTPRPDIVIIDDALFAEDVALFRQDQLTLIRVIRGVEKNFTAISNPDYTVINANGVEYLAKRVDQIMGTMNAGPRGL
jgi:hypothetical protein